MNPHLFQYPKLNTSTEVQNPLLHTDLFCFQLNISAVNFISKCKYVHALTNYCSRASNTNVDYWISGGTEIHNVLYNFICG